MPSRPPTHRPRGYSGARREAQHGHNRARNPVVARVHGSAAWRHLSGWILRHRPLCEMCKSQGRTHPSVEVHHIHPISTHRKLAFERSNLESLCVPCHRRADAKLRQEARGA